MLEESSFGLRNTVDITNAPVSVKHPKTVAAERRAAQVPLEVTLLTTAQVARALSVSQITVWRYAQRGYFCPVKLGTGGPRCARRYRAVDIARFIEERLAGGTAATE
jgi:Helix-turn-helix domain